MPAEIGILLLRGVNVGGHGRLPMAALRDLLDGLGLLGVQTHIQSGNAVFRAPQGLAGLAERIAAAIAAVHGFAPVAMVLDLAGLDAVLAANPFAAEGTRNGASVQIGFLGAASATDPDALRALAANGEALHLTDHALYLHAPAGTGRSVLAQRAERLLGVPMTTRNQRVADAVAALAHGW